ncbi:MAG: hypothetical protein R2860_09180 [Desulfobacterales bacterium]
MPPLDKFQDIRTEMMLTLEDLGIDVECQHHEVATAGQAEIDMRFKPLLQMGDQLVWFKYVLKNVAYKHGHTVTFMPKPLYGDNGSGIPYPCQHLERRTAVVCRRQICRRVRKALYAISGILKHF